MGPPEIGSGRPTRSRKKRGRRRRTKSELKCGGRRALVAGQKSGVVHAIDPDKQGEVLWQKRVGKGGINGGVQWGSAADQTNVYVALSDLGRFSVHNSLATEPDPKVGGGMFALHR